MTLAATAAGHVQEHRGELTQFVAAMVGNGLAEELVQEAYMRLSRAMTLQTIDNPRAYLFRIAANLARDALRRDKREKHYKASEPTDAASPAAGEIVARQQELELLRAAIERLPDKCRRVFVARKYDNMSYREIAAVEQISEKTVENHIGRALKLLRADLERSLN